ncbi:MAG: spore coat associated protein CotJA [Clostridia bacterium]|nr:spore coat associated protein CotJA [Oscillospiraceae bacterium]MBQ9733768.1 spore coat associated protein CotJA [Clostridia bacterium]
MEKEYCEKLPLAIATVPMQKFEHLYCLEDALEKGTVFADLDLPFEGKEDC